MERPWLLRPLPTEDLSFLRGVPTALETAGSEVGLALPGGARSTNLFFFLKYFSNMFFCLFFLSLFSWCVLCWVVRLLFFEFLERFFLLCGLSEVCCFLQSCDGLYWMFFSTCPWGGFALVPEENACSIWHLLATSVFPSALRFWSPGDFSSKSDGKSRWGGGEKWALASGFGGDGSTSESRWGNVEDLTMAQKWVPKNYNKVIFFSLPSPSFTFIPI